MDKIWLSFTGCSWLQTALIKSGYADFFSLETINENSLAELEEFISQPIPTTVDALVKREGDEISGDIAFNITVNMIFWF